jgi:hypothetical protein
VTAPADAPAPSPGEASIAITSRTAGRVTTYTALVKVPGRQVNILMGRINLLGDSTTITVVGEVIGELLSERVTREGLDAVLLDLGAQGVLLVSNPDLANLN